MRSLLVRLLTESLGFKSYKGRNLFMEFLLHLSSQICCNQYTGCTVSLGRISTIKFPITICTCIFVSSIFNLAKDMIIIMRLELEFGIIYVDQQQQNLNHFVPFISTNRRHLKLSWGHDKQLRLNMTVK